MLGIYRDLQKINKLIDSSNMNMEEIYNIRKIIQENYMPIPEATEKGFSHVYIINVNNLSSGTFETVSYGFTNLLDAQKYIYRHDASVDKLSNFFFKGNKFIYRIEVLYIGV